MEQDNSSVADSAASVASDLTAGEALRKSEGFTPGPYEVWSSLYEGFSASVVVNTDPLKTLAHVRSYRDALLFAAAPDLYEALKAIVAWDDNPAGYGGLPYHLRLAAEAALAQARGEA